MSEANVSVGAKAPDFSLPSLKRTDGKAETGGAPVTLAEFLGKKNIVLFFYPKDDSPGCTVEACEFRDAYEDFVAAGAEVIGISSDSMESHAAFAQKHRLPMQFLADAGGRVRKLYGVKSTLGLIPGRETFIIDKSGIVRHVFRSQLRVKKHVAEALEVLRRL